MAQRIRTLELCDDWALGGTALDAYIRVAHLNRELFNPLAVGFSGRGPWLEAAAQGGVATASCAGSFDHLEQLIADFAPHILHTVRNTHLNPFLVTAQRLARGYGVVVEVETNMFGRPGRDAGWVAPTFVRHVSRASMLRYAGLAGVPMSQLYRRGDRVIYLPILTQPFAGGGPGPAEREQFRRKLGARPDEVLACRVGRADLRKWSPRL